MEITKKSKKALDKAVKVLKNGGVVICPTDTVYGFLADAGNKKAVEKIYKIKKRHKSKPLPVFVKDFKMARGLAEIDESQAKILRKFWHGKYTFILKRKTNVKLYGVAKNTIALRIPNYPFLNNVLKKIKRPLVQTSVNVSNKPALVNISDIINQFSKQNILIINGGNIKKNKSSKILDLTNGKLKILRK